MRAAKSAPTAEKYDRDVAAYAAFCAASDDLPVRVGYIPFGSLPLTMYAVHLASEGRPANVIGSIWSAIGDAEDENGTNAIRLHKATAADGTRVSEHMVKILRGS